MKRAASGLLLLMLYVSIALAQHPRTPLFEEFTSSTCPPCAAVKPYVEQFAEEVPDAVVVTYHEWWPAPGDPYNVYNGVDDTVRVNYYGVSGIPAGFMNGQSIYPGSVQALKDAAEQVRQQSSPLLITITEDRSQTPIRVTVTVKNDGTSPINNAVLHTYVLNYYADLTQQLQGQPQHVYTTFEFAQLLALPNERGTSFSIAPGETKTFNLTYRKGTHYIWAPNQQYVIAFVQIPTTREVLQAATTLNLNRVEITSSTLPQTYTYAPRNTNHDHEITVHNPTDRTLQVQLSVNTTSSYIPSGWNVTINPTSITLQAGEEKTVAISVTAPDAGSFMIYQIDLVPQASAGINKTTAYTRGYLTENTKYAVVAGYMGSGIMTFYQAIASGQKYANETAILPAAAAQQLAPLPCQTVVLPIDYNGRSALQLSALLGLINSWINQGTNVYIYGQLEAFYAFRGLSNPNPTTQQLMRQLGIQDVRLFPNPAGSGQVPYHHLSVQGNQVTITPFTVQGKSGDSISNGINISCNQGTSYPNPYTDVLILSSNPVNRVTPIFTYDNNSSYIGGVRVTTQQGTRIVYTTFGLEAIGNVSQRNAVAQRIMDWLSQSRGRIEILGASGSGNSYSLSFDEVKVGESKTQTIRIRNSGSANITVTSLQMTGDMTYANAFSITAGNSFPVTLSPEQEHAVTIEFRPRRAESLQAVTYTLTTDQGDAIEITAYGDGVQASPVEPTQASSNGLTLSITPNPLTTDATITYAVQVPSAAEIVLVDTQGRLVTQLLSSSTASEGTLHFDAASIPSGVYRLALRSGNAQVSVPVVIVK